MTPNKRPASESSLPDVIKRPCKATVHQNMDTTCSDDAAIAEEVAAVSGHTNIAPSVQLVWATNRQALCDAIPNFKSHQSGVYTKENQPYGVLFGKNVEIGDAMMANKGIYNLGGGRTQDKHGSWKRNENYKPKDFTAWETAKKDQSAILVVMNHQHPDFQNIDISSIPKQSGVEPAYVVLGVFFVTEVWQEMSQCGGGNQYPVVKVMLQRVHADTKPSYWKGDYRIPQAHDIQDSFSQHICSDCGKTSPAAFKDQPFLCLNHNCRSFFSSNGAKLQRDTLEYTPGFLNWTKPFIGDLSQIPAAVPDTPSIGDEEYGTELRFRAGMVCSRCKHCDSRVWFHCWECTSCGLIRVAQPEPYPLVEIEDETQQHTDKLMSQSKFFRLDKTTIFMHEFHVNMYQTQTDKSVRTTYLILEADGSLGGSVVHERPSQEVIQGSCGANELWNELQKPEVVQNFKRYAARGSGSVVQKLTKHFIQNFGFHYDYGVKVDDTSFDAAPDVVLKALAQLSHMGKLAVEVSQELAVYGDFHLSEDTTLKEAWQQPNEVLVLAYMENDKINYHDDGEEQLSGTISTLSLGSPATMKLRIKGKGGRFGMKAGPILVLKVQLQHGDVVTMCDTRLQAFTEHTIEPVGIRRFAMTSRVIKPEYYLQPKPAQKLAKHNLTVEAMKESAQIPARAAAFTFQGTHLQTHNSSPTD